MNNKISGLELPYSSVVQQFWVDFLIFTVVTLFIYTVFGKCSLVVFWGEIMLLGGVEYS